MHLCCVVKYCSKLWYVTCNFLVNFNGLVVFKFRLQKTRVSTNARNYYFITYISIILRFIQQKDRGSFTGTRLLLFLGSSPHCHRGSYKLTLSSPNPKRAIHT